MNNVVATTQIDSTATLGDHVMRVSPSHPTNHQMRQRMNLFDEVGGLDVGATIRHKHTFTGTVDGDVRVSVNVRNVDYISGNCDEVSPGAFIQRAGENYSPSTSWVTQSITYPSESYELPDVEGVDIEIRLKNRLTDAQTGGSISLLVDFLTAVQYTQ